MTIIVTTGGQPVESIPVAIPSNARIASFLPYAQIMPEIDLLITNGGYGTVNMAISHGIPVISAGLTEDKEEVSAHVQWSGAGIDLRTNQATPEAIKHAVDEIYAQPRYRERAHQLALEFASHDVKAELLSLIEECVCETWVPGLPEPYSNITRTDDYAGLSSEKVLEKDSRMSITTRQQMIATSHGSVAVEESGQGGIPVLLIHGNSFFRDVFRNQIQGQIAKTHRFITFDLPGHGQSSNAPDPQRSYTRPGLTDAAIELLDELGIAEAIVLGWSLGGHIGIEMMRAFRGYAA